MPYREPYDWPQPPEPSESELAYSYLFDAKCHLVQFAKLIRDKDYIYHRSTS